MNTPPGDGAALARVLAGALSLGLPGPDSITISPHVTAVSAIDFQFNANYGQDPLPALTAWAARFGVTVDVSADSKDPASTWHEFNFTHRGVLFHAYAKIKAATVAEDEPAPGGYVTVEEAARHVAARLGATGDGDDGEPLFDGPVTTRADLDKAYEQATPLVIPAGTLCARTGCGHPESKHYASGPGDGWDDGWDSCHAGDCKCRDFYLRAREPDGDGALRIAPGESAGPAAFPACVCGDPVTAHRDDGRDRVPCRKPGCGCPDYEIPADREHEILPAASTA